MPGPPPPSSRRRPRIGLRGAMALVLVCAVGLGGVVRRAHAQRRAAAAIERAGGRVIYDWQDLDAAAADWRRRLAPVVVAPAVDPWWLVDRLGIDYTGHVTSVAPGPASTDAELEHVGRLGRLTHLYADDARITDAGMAHLAGLARLQVVSLGGCRGNTGASLVHLAGSPGIRSLALGGVPIGDVRLARPADLLPGRLDLDPSGTAVTGAGLAGLAGLERLERLRLDDTAIADSGCRHLARLAHLVALSLRGTPVGDAGVASLGGDSPIRDLDLSGTAVTDAGPDHLARWPRLGLLRLRGAKVTPARLDSLRKARPALVIDG